MALKGYYVKHVERKEIRDFVETWHYSKRVSTGVLQIIALPFTTLNMKW